MGLGRLLLVVVCVAVSPPMACVRSTAAGRIDFKARMYGIAQGTKNAPKRTLRCLACSSESYCFLSQIPFDCVFFFCGPLAARQLERSDLYPGAGGRMANSWDEAAVRELSRLPTVDRVFGLGSVLAVEMKSAKRG